MRLRRRNSFTVNITATNSRSYYIGHVHKYFEPMAEPKAVLPNKWHTELALDPKLGPLNL